MHCRTYSLSYRDAPPTWSVFVILSSGVDILLCYLICSLQPLYGMVHRKHYVIRKLVTAIVDYR